MKSIFIDPVVVTTPSEDATRDDVVMWLDTLVIWLKEVSSSPYKWMHAVKATELLDAHGRFPNFELLRAWQRKYYLDINVSIIVQALNTFFRDTTFDLGNDLEQPGYLVEASEGTVAIIPEQLAHRWLTCIRHEIQELFITMCACKHVGLPFVESLHIVTLPLADIAREVEISAIIEDALPISVREIGDKISQKFPLLFAPDDLLPLRDVMSLWNQGEKGIRYAIEQQFKNDWLQAIGFALPFRLGSCFIESIEQAGLDTNEIVLRKIVRSAAAVIAGKAMDVKKYNLRHLRVTRAADSPQLIRASDGAKAWRLTLSESGAGWRMHYWYISMARGSEIEFANVLKESAPKEIC